MTWAVTVIEETLFHTVMPAASSPAIHLYSFSYQRGGIPPDEWGHGGGFVVDCRCLPNPGRLPQYQPMIGSDAEIVTYFQREPLVDRFVQSVLAMIDVALTGYASGNFEHVTMAFGCTGGRHRSVYCAGVVQQSLLKRGYDVTLRHLALEW
jgi:RNase adaptor protein for sRNA GlmZ degradation